MLVVGAAAGRFFWHLWSMSNSKETDQESTSLSTIFKASGVRGSIDACGVSLFVKLVGFSSFINI